MFEIYDARLKIQRPDPKIFFESDPRETRGFISGCPAGQLVVSGVDCLNPCPPEPFSVTCPPKGGGQLLQPLLEFFIFNALYPYIYYQCIAMGLLFLLIQKVPYPSSYDITMTP